MGRATHERSDDLPPALIDAGIQLVGILDGLKALSLPLAVDHVWIASAMPRRVRVKAKLTGRTERTITADVVFESADGVAVGALTDYVWRLQRLMHSCWQRLMFTQSIGSRSRSARRLDFGAGRSSAEDGQSWD